MEEKERKTIKSADRKISCVTQECNHKMIPRPEAFVSWCEVWVYTSLIISSGFIKVLEKLMNDCGPWEMWAMGLDSDSGLVLILLTILAGWSGHDYCVTGLS